MVCEEYNHVGVLNLDGDLIADQIAVARKAFDAKLETRDLAGFIVDFEKCSFADSEGLELLLEMKRRCEDRFGQFKLVGIDENMKKILEITRLEQRFESHIDLAAALKNFR